MNYSDDHIALAAEYALGTLDADERALVETMMIVDHGFKDVVDAWDAKLAPLHQMVGAIEPPAYVWDRIKAEAGLTGKQIPMTMPDFNAAPAAPAGEPKFSLPPHDFTAGHQDVVRQDVAGDTPVKPYSDLALVQNNTRLPEPEDDSADLERELFGHESAPSVVVPPRAEQTSNVVPMARPGRGGAVYGAFMTAVAASLAAVVALQAYRPELLPVQLRIKPKIQTVEIKTPAPPAGAQFVALLQQDSSLPAFVLTVDLATKNFTVRKVGATAEPGKSYELWLVSDKLQRPRSLGVIGGADFTVRPALAAYDNDTINRATYAVTVEPEGGSPTGVATGPIVFTGKLFESVPAAPAPR